MFIIKMAEIRIAIKNKYSYVYEQCRDYLAPGDEYDIDVFATDEEIETEKKAVEIKVSDGYAESVCIYRNICNKLPQTSGAFLFHSALIEYEGRGYAFAAKSGTGKSTHISLWQRCFGNNVRIINGDKPIFRYTDGKFIAYGTPWCGKEGLSENASVPVCAICFIERGEKNSISQISPSDAVTKVFPQVLMPRDARSVDALFPLLDSMIKSIPCYLLKCNMDIEAALVAYNGMKNTEDKYEN